MPRAGARMQALVTASRGGLDPAATRARAWQTLRASATRQATEEAVEARATCSQRESCPPTPLVHTHMTD
jgi:hypothetical protein